MQAKQTNGAKASKTSSLLAERGNEGSRGLQPTDQAGEWFRRGATIDETPQAEAVVRRRSATRLPFANNRGLKPTATVIWSLRDLTRSGRLTSDVEDNNTTAPTVHEPSTHFHPETAHSTTNQIMKTRQHSLASILLALCVAWPCAPARLHAQPLPDLPFASGSTGADGPLQIRPSTAPRYHHAMAYDAARQQTVLFGGYFNGTNNDTWIWQGGGWRVSGTTSSPPARYTHNMVYDGARNETILFGGYPGSGPNYIGDTWAWDGTNWSARPGGPAARGYQGMAYDEARRQVVMFGGYPTRNDTWLWNGTNWSLASPANRPLER
jgi:hypothetical protein